MASKKNKWRKCGRLEFMRETKRYSDGTAWGHDVLFIRIKGKACAFVEPFDWSFKGTKETLCIHTGTYEAATPLTAARRIRAYLIRESMERAS
jgi:hypothetical protein